MTISMGDLVSGLIGGAGKVIACSKRNELDDMQDDALIDFEGTSALTAVANLLTQAGQPTSMNDSCHRMAA